MKKLIYAMLIMVILLTGCGQKATEETGAAVTEETGASSEEESVVSLTEEELAAVQEALNLKHELRCGEDGKFRILVLSDIQAAQIMPIVKERIQILVDRENPDLVLFCGDNIKGKAFSEIDALQKYLADMVEYVESKQIPWAHVYGNHDAESIQLSKEEQEEVYESFEYCLSKKGDVTGVGNYVLPILKSDSDDIVFNVFGLDSGAYNMDVWKVTEGKYDYIHFDQIMWYRETSELLEKYNGNMIPAMMYFHIPLPESDIAWNYRDILVYEGEVREYGAAQNGVNSGMFAAAHDRGDVKIIVNGHDHINNAMIDYFGIKLSYAMTITSTEYHDKDMLGGRVVVIDQNNAEKVETYLSYVE